MLLRQKLLSYGFTNTLPRTSLFDDQIMFFTETSFGDIWHGSELPSYNSIILDASFRVFPEYKPLYIDPCESELGTGSNIDTFARPGPRWGVGTGRWKGGWGVLPIQGLLPPGLHCHPLLPKDVTDILNNQVCGRTKSKFIMIENGPGILVTLANRGPRFLIGS